MIVFLVFEENQETEVTLCVRVCSTSERAEKLVNELRIEAEIATKNGDYPNLYWWTMEEVEES